MTVFVSHLHDQISGQTLLWQEAKVEAWDRKQGVIVHHQNCVYTPVLLERASDPMHFLLVSFVFTPVIASQDKEQEWRPYCWHVLKKEVECDQGNDSHYDSLDNPPLHTGYSPLPPYHRPPCARFMVIVFFRQVFVARK